MLHIATLEKHGDTTVAVHVVGMQPVFMSITCVFVMPTHNSLLQASDEI